ncbi:MAG: hypothetical protein ACOVVK_17235 [Elsteraceae bacterium]
MPRADHYPPDIMDRYAAFIWAAAEEVAVADHRRYRSSPDLIRFQEFQDQDSSSVKGEKKTSTRQDHVMAKNSHGFDFHYYRRLSESIHDCGHDLTDTTTRIYNKLSTRIFKYLERFDPLPPPIIELLSSLLSHPKRGVRVQAAADLLVRGYSHGWPAILEAAAPAYFPDDDAPLNEWRDFCAHQNARCFITGLYKSIEHLPLNPTLEDAEEQWLKETGVKASIAVLPAIIQPNIPIR